MSHDALFGIAVVTVVVCGNLCFRYFGPWGRLSRLYPMEPGISAQTFRFLTGSLHYRNWSSLNRGFLTCQLNDEGLAFKSMLQWPRILSQNALIPWRQLVFTELRNDLVAFSVGEFSFTLNGRIVAQMREFQRRGMLIPWEAATSLETTTHTT